jgi:prevent-host-death family protein
MKTVTAAELQRNIGRYQDMALREPVAVTRNGRESCVMISTDEYRRLKRRDRQVFHVDTASEAQLQEMIEFVSKSEMPPGFEHLDKELKDWKP